MQRNKILDRYRFNVTPNDGITPESEWLHSTYDQFIQLRDTLLFSWKQYSGKAGCTLVVWEKEETIEVQWKNRFHLWFEPGFDNFQPYQEGLTLNREGPYVTWLADSSKDAWYFARFGVLAVRINEAWHYQLNHREQVIPRNDTTEVNGYIYQYIKKPDGTYYNNPGDEQYRIKRAVFQRAIDPTVTTTLTCQGYLELNLNKDDILVLQCEDQNGVTFLNNSDIQENSNYMQVKYLSQTLN